MTNTNIKVERFNHTHAWRVAVGNTHYIGSYYTLVAIVHVFEHALDIVELLNANVGYSPTTTKQVTQLLREWYKIDFAASDRKYVMNESITHSDTYGDIITSELFKFEPTYHLYNPFYAAYNDMSGEIGDAINELYNCYEVKLTNEQIKRIYGYAHVDSCYMW